MYYVKTVYDPRQSREPDIREYETKEKAQQFIDTCLKWGVGIVSCDFVERAQSSAQTFRESQATRDT